MELNQKYVGSILPRMYCNLKCPCLPGDALEYKVKVLLAVDAAQVVEEEVVGQPAAALAVAAVAEPGRPATATAPSPASRNERGGGVLVERGDQDLQGHLH